EHVLVRRASAGLADEEVGTHPVEGDPEEASEDPVSELTQGLDEEAQIDGRVVRSERLLQGADGPVDRGKGPAGHAPATGLKLAVAEGVFHRRIAGGEGVEAALRPGTGEARAPVGVDGKAGCETVVGDLARPGAMPHDHGRGQYDQRRQTSTA